MHFYLLVYLFGVVNLNPQFNDLNQSSPCTDESKEWLEANIVSITENIGYEGSQIVKSPTKECTYLIASGVVDMESSKNKSSLIRVASSKARRQALLFLGNPKITSETITTTEEIISDEDVKFLQTYFDSISENASGFVGALQALKSFEAENGSLFVYVVYKELD